MNGEVRQLGRRDRRFAMHAMNGRRKGLTMKRRFDSEADAQVEADKLNADRPGPAEFLSVYPCLFTDDRVWEEDAEPHWHMGRDRALREPP